MTDTQTEARAIAQKWHSESADVNTLADYIATTLAAKDAELARLREFERQHDYCCCGDRIDAHNIGSGHAPVSVFDYEYGRAVERAERAEAQLAEANKALDRITALDSHIDATPRGDRKVIYGEFASIARRALEAQECK